jgi:hypothetical protein
MGDIIPGRLGLIRLIHQVTLQATEHTLVFFLCDFLDSRQPIFMHAYVHSCKF